MSTVEDLERQAVPPVDSKLQESLVPPDPEESSPSAGLAAACLFWMLCLTLTAAGHRLYKATVSADRVVSQERYRTEGKRIVWVGHGSVEDALARTAAGDSIEPVSSLRTLPNSVFWLSSCVAFTVLAGLLAWAGRWLVSNGIQSMMGLFAGHFLWLGSIEFGLDAVGRRLGLAGSLEAVNGRVVGTHGAGFLIQMSAVFLIPVLIGLALHESNRCAMFQWVRRRLPLTRSVSASGRIENYAARTTIQYFMTVWFCYVGVLWLADPGLGRAGEVALLLVMAAIFMATPWLIWRAARQSSKGKSLRYSVSGAVVTWTGIEIAAAMHLFREPWLSTSTSSGLVLLIITVVLTAIAAMAFSKQRIAQSGSALTAILVFALLTPWLAGCSESEGIEPVSADDISLQLLTYEERMTIPDPTARDGLLHALASSSPEMVAQAAMAFGRMEYVDDFVREQLQRIALSDDSRLTQFAALQALVRLESMSEETQEVLDDLLSDSDWRDLARRIETGQ